MCYVQRSNFGDKCVSSACPDGVFWQWHSCFASLGDDICPDGAIRSVYIHL